MCEKDLSPILHSDPFGRKCPVNIPFPTSPEQKSRIPQIAARMKKKGLPPGFIHSVSQLAQFDQGVFDLMDMWLAEQEAVTADLHEALKDYGVIPGQRGTNSSLLDRPTMITQAKQLLSEAETFGFEVKPGTAAALDATLGFNDVTDSLQLWRMFCDQCVHADSYAIGTVTRTMHTALAECLQPRLTPFNKKVFVNMVAATKKGFLERDPVNEVKAARFSATKHKQAQMNKNRASIEDQANSAWGGGD